MSAAQPQGAAGAGERDHEPVALRLHLVGRRGRATLLAHDLGCGSWSTSIQRRSPRRSVTAVDPSMSEKRRVTVPSGERVGGQVGALVGHDRRHQVDGGQLLGRVDCPGRPASRRAPARSSGRRLRAGGRPRASPASFWTGSQSVPPGQMQEPGAAERRRLVKWEAEAAERFCGRHGARSRAASNWPSAPSTAASAMASAGGLAPEVVGCRRQLGGPVEMDPGVAWATAVGQENGELGAGPQLVHALAALDGEGEGVRQQRLGRLQVSLLAGQQPEHAGCWSTRHGGCRPCARGPSSPPQHAGLVEAAFVEGRDHGRGVAAVELELERDHAEAVRETARLHEVGNVYVPAAVLKKPAGRAERGGHRAWLDLAGFVRGAELARGAGVPERACEWIGTIRERFDGGGPAGLAGEANLPDRVADRARCLRLRHGTGGTGA